MGIRLTYNYLTTAENSTTTFFRSLTSFSTIHATSASTTHEFSSNQLAAISISALVLSLFVVACLVTTIIYRCKRTAVVSRRPVQQQVQTMSELRNSKPCSQGSSGSDVTVNMQEIKATSSSVIKPVSTISQLPIIDSTRKTKSE